MDHIIEYTQSDIEKCIKHTAYAHSISEDDVIQVLESEIEILKQRQVLLRAPMSRWIHIGKKFDQVKNFTVAELKIALRERSIPVSGKKDEMVNLLVAYETKTKIKSPKKSVEKKEDPSTKEGRMGILSEYTYSRQGSVDYPHVYKVMDINFTSDDEPFSLLITYRLAMNVSYSSLFDLAKYSTYISRLVKSEDFWACRFLIRPNQISKLSGKIRENSPDISWQKLCSLFRSPAFILPYQTTYDIVKNLVWQNQPPRSLEINGDIARQDGVSWIGLLDNDLYVSFTDPLVDVYPIYFGLKELRETRIYNFIPIHKYPAEPHDKVESISLNEVEYIKH